MRVIDGWVRDLDISGFRPDGRIQDQDHDKNKGAAEGIILHVFLPRASFLRMVQVRCMVSRRRASAMLEAPRDMPPGQGI